MYIYIYTQIYIYICIYIIHHVQRHWHLQFRNHLWFRNTTAATLADSAMIPQVMQSVRSIQPQYYDNGVSRGGGRPACRCGRVRQQVEHYIHNINKLVNTSIPI